MFIIMSIITAILFFTFWISTAKKDKNSPLSKTQIISGLLLLATFAYHIPRSFNYLVSRPPSILIAGYLTLIFIIFTVYAGFKNRSKLTLGVIGTLFLTFTYLITIGWGVMRYQNRVSNITIEEIDITALPDGVFTGSYDVYYIAAEVEVTIESGTITQIELVEHRGERGEEAEVVVDRIIQQQQVAVDAVSGATNSSMVIQQAIQNALESAK